MFFFEKGTFIFFLHKFSNELININSELNKKNIMTGNGHFKLDISNNYILLNIMQLSFDID